MEIWLHTFTTDPERLLDIWGPSATQGMPNLQRLLSVDIPTTYHGGNVLQWIADEPHLIPERCTESFRGKSATLSAKVCEPLMKIRS